MRYPEPGKGLGGTPAGGRTSTCIPAPAGSPRGPGPAASGSVMRLCFWWRAAPWGQAGRAAGDCVWGGITGRQRAGQQGVRGRWAACRLWGYQLLRCARGGSSICHGSGGDRKRATTLSPRSASGESEEPRRALTAPGTKLVQGLTRSTGSFQTPTPSLPHGSSLPRSLAPSSSSKSQPASLLQSPYWSRCRPGVGMG